MRAAVCRFYKAFCRRYGPRRMTVSAWLYARELEGCGYFLREFIDDHFLVFHDQDDHCRKAYEKEIALLSEDSGRARLQRH